MNRYFPFRSIVVFAFLAACALVPPPLPLQAAGSGSIRITIRPEVLLADGQSTATITAEVRDSRGDRVPDGTDVRFTTTAGSIDASALTSAGTARATFTSASIPDTAQISVFSAGASATARLPMVSELPDLKIGGTIVRVRGKYVAYSENLRVLEAADQATATFRGIEVAAQRLQVDLGMDVLRAHGGVRVKSRGHELTGERLYLNLRALQGVLLGLDGRRNFEGVDLLEVRSQAQEAKAESAPSSEAAPAGSSGTPAPASRQDRRFAGVVSTADFNLTDLSDSLMLWTAKRALAFLGDRVQLQGATAYWVGARLLPLGNHEIPLDGSEVGTDRYVGVGSSGLVVDLPYYLSLGAGGSTAVRLRHGDRSGFGYFAHRPGWQLDLERKYGEPGSVEGLFTLNRLTGSDWGLRWQHNHPLGQTARLYAFLDFPAHRDLYGQLNLNKQWGWGTSTLSLSANKFRDRALGRSLDLGVESRPKEIGAGFRLSLEGRVQDSRGGEFVRLHGRRFQVPGVTQQQVGLKLRPPALQLGRDSHLSTSLTARHAWGTRQGVGLVGSASFTQKLGGNNLLTLNYNYNQVPGYSYLGNSGRQNLSGTLYLRSGDRFRLTAFGLLGLDNPIRSLTGAAAYRLTPSWRLDLQHTFYQFGIFDASDTQIGVARALGPREILLYWSTERRRLGIEVGVNNF